MNWLAILRHQVAVQGRPAVLNQLGIKKPTLSLLLNEKYPGRTEKMEERVMKVFGTESIRCPALGSIDLKRCSETHARAQKLNGKAGNPDTLRLYQTCLNCPTRKEGS